ncbi:hypothetical protein KEM54_002958 [Ascosphaera aggregata]|nr:hypothetical protein KEM54_002958 [Ascosphaera aggregata]
MSDVNGADKSASNLRKHKRFASRYYDLSEVSPKKPKAMKETQGFQRYHDLPKVADVRVSSFSVHIRQDDDSYNSLLESRVGTRDSGLVPMPLLENKSVDRLSFQTPSITCIDTTPSTFKFQFPFLDAEMNEQGEFQEESSVDTISITSSIDESDINDEVEFQTAVPRTIGRGYKAQLISISSKALEAGLSRNCSQRAGVSNANHESTRRALTHQISGPRTAQSSDQLNTNDCHAPSARDCPLPSLPPSTSRQLPPLYLTHTAALNHSQHDCDLSPTELISPLSRSHPNHDILWMQTDGRAGSPCLNPATSSLNLYLRSEESNSSRRSLASRSSRSGWRGSGLRSFFSSARRMTKDNGQPRHHSESSPNILTNPTKLLARRFSPAGRTNVAQIDGRKAAVPRIAPVTRVWSDSNMVAQEHTVQHSLKQNFSSTANVAPSVMSLGHLSSGATSATSGLSSSPASSTTSAGYRASVQENRQRAQSLAGAFMRPHSIRLFRVDYAKRRTPIGGNAVKQEVRNQV